MMKGITRNKSSALFLNIVVLLGLYLRDSTQQIIDPNNNPNETINPITAKTPSAFCAKVAIT